MAPKTAADGVEGSAASALPLGRGLGAAATGPGMAVGQSVGVVSVSSPRMSFAAASRSVRAGIPKGPSTVASTKVWSQTVWSTTPAAMSGDTTIAGTRTPYRSNGKCVSLRVKPLRRRKGRRQDPRPCSARR